MIEPVKTRDQLVLELAEAHQRIAELEMAEAERVAEELRKHNEQLEEKMHLQNLAKKYFEVAGVIFVVLDSDGAIIQINKAGCEILGYGQGELLGENWFDTCLPPSGRDVMINGHLVGDLERDEYIENSVITKSGEARTIVWNNAWLRDAAGTVVQSLSAGMDITERKQAEEALQELHFIINRSSVIVFLWRAADNWPVEFVSDNVQEFGYLVDDFYMQRTSFADIIHPEDRERVSAEVLQYSSEEGRTEFEQSYRIVTKDGETRWTEDHTWIRRDPAGNITHYQGIIQDITERKKVEEDLRRSEERYRALFEHTNDGIFILNLDGIHIEINQQAADMLGYSIDEIVGRSNSGFIVSDEYHDMEKQKAAILAGETLPVYIRTFIRKDGTMFPVEINAALVYDTNGKPSHFHSVVRDITERKQMEQQHLELVLEKERIQILANFITQASHEFRTPLSIINTSSYLMGRLDNPDKKIGHIDRIKEQVSNIATLIDMLNLMARLDSGIYDFRLEEIDMNTILRAICDPAQETFQEKTIHVVLELSESPLWLKLDYEYLGQAIGHIMSNAVRFTPNEGKITVSSECIDGEVVIEIADTGTGIDEGVLPHIFERFYRADTSGKTRGFGLGLPIAKAIIESHHGIIDVESTAGEGAIFRISLPVA